MSGNFTTEITSDSLPSDNPLHQRLLKPYVLVAEHVNGEVLEVGCGEGRGLKLLSAKAGKLTAVDRIGKTLARLQERFPAVQFLCMNIPPLTGIHDNTFDFIVSFQVIEHIQYDELFLKEIHRVLKPGGMAWITTPNRLMTLTRNPWHIREYTGPELHRLAAGVFREVIVQGLTGNERVMKYYEQNKSSVARITRWDVLKLQYRLPAWMLRLPYELLNRLSRNHLKKQDTSLVAEITHADYRLTDDVQNALDLYAMVKK